MVVPADAPCTDWCSGDDVAACAGIEAGAKADALATVASQLLYWRSGRQWPGVCDVTVSPTMWAPLVPRWEQTRVRCGCGCGSWSSTRYPLPTGPVVAVTEVLIGDTPLDPTSWRVDDWSTLVRTDGRPWPCRGWTVTYQAGEEPPAAGAYAARTLACEMAKAADGDDSCRLPTRVTELVRQDVTLAMTPIGELLEQGLTGIPEVDHFVGAVNPHGAMGRARVRNPDAPRQSVINT